MVPGIGVTVMDTADERYRSRKWILFTGTLIGASVAALSLICFKLFGNLNAPEIGSLLNWWALLASTILGGYGAVNLLAKGKSK